MKNEGKFNVAVLLTFVNISDEEFVGRWDGNEQIFAPGQAEVLPEFLASAYAKQLIEKLAQVKEEGKKSKDRETGRVIYQGEGYDEQYRLELESQILKAPDYQPTNQIGGQIIASQALAKLQMTPQRKLRGAPSDPKVKISEVQGMKMPTVQSENMEL